MSEVPESMAGTTVAATNGPSTDQPETSEISTGAGVSVPHVQLQLPEGSDEAVHPPTLAPSLLQFSAPGTAATSMLTIVPVEDEKSEDQVREEGGLSETGNEGSGAAPPATSSALPPASPKVALIFLLISGTRRPMSFDPSTTIGRVKELVWFTWPGDTPENEAKPPSPNHLRILYQGKILQDEDTLTNIGFPVSTPTPSGEGSSPTSTSPTATIVHLSIRPVAPSSEDGDTVKKNFRAARRALSRSGSQAVGTPGTNGGAGDGAHGGGCCGCVIM